MTPLADDTMRSAKPEARTRAMTSHYQSRSRRLLLALAVATAATLPRLAAAEAVPPHAPGQPSPGRAPPGDLRLRPPELPAKYEQSYLIPALEWGCCS